MDAITKINHGKKRKSRDNSNPENITSGALCTTFSGSINLRTSTNSHYLIISLEYFDTLLPYLLRFCPIL